MREYIIKCVLSNLMVAFKGIPPIFMGIGLCGVGWKLVCIRDMDPFPLPAEEDDTASYCHSGAAVAAE